MNSALLQQLKEQNFELQQAFLKDPEKMAQLQARDKVLQQYLLEEETKENIFDWIRDFKDYEIRNSLQKRIDQLTKEVSMRDQKILQLQIQCEEMVMNVDMDHEGDQRKFLNEDSLRSQLSMSDSNSKRLDDLQ